MSDKLTDRLRGQYSVGPNGEYGTRSFADFIPPISIEAADRIEALESSLSYMVANIGQPRSIETSAGFKAAENLLKKII